MIHCLELSKILICSSNSIKKPEQKCSACCLRKLSRLSLSSTKSVSSEPLQLVHVDVWGPSLTFSFNGEKYFVVFLDDFSKYSWIYPLKNKSEVFDVFVQFHLMVEKMACQVLESVTI